MCGIMFCKTAREMFEGDIYRKKIGSGARVHVKIVYNPRTDHVGVYSYRSYSKPPTDRQTKARADAIKRHNDRMK